MAFTVLYDACVLYPVSIRDLLISLAGTGLFRARWSDMIHDEWIRNVVKNNRHITADKLERTRNSLNAAVPDCIVTGFEGRIKTLNLPDKKDRHVLAAAITGKADVLVTFNIKDFPADYLAQFEITPKHPDDFVAELIAQKPELVCECIKGMRLRWINEPYSAEELLELFERRGLIKTANALTEFADDI